MQGFNTYNGQPAVQRPWNCTYSILNKFNIFIQSAKTKLRTKSNKTKLTKTKNKFTAITKYEINFIPSLIKTSKTIKKPTKTNNYKTPVNNKTNTWTTKNNTLHNKAFHKIKQKSININKTPKTI